MAEYLIHSCADCPFGQYVYRGCDVPVCHHPNGKRTDDHLNFMELGNDDDELPNIIPDDCPLMMNGALTLQVPTRMLKELKLDSVSFVPDNGDPSLGRIEEKIGDTEIQRRIETLTKRDVRIVLIKFEIVFFTFIDQPDRLSVLRIRNGELKEINSSIHKVLEEKFTWRVLDAVTCAQIAHMIKTIDVDK